MPRASSVPRRLYKYRAFSSRALDMLVADEFHFADPRDFNDPLDSRPTLEADLDEDALERLLFKLVEQRIRAEMTAAAASIKYRGPRTAQHVSRLSHGQATQVIREVRYQADDPFSDEVPDPLRTLLRQYLEDELLRRYDKGVVSFGARATCPLMWSHYGDQHKGLCLGYSVPADAVGDLHKIGYGGSRKVLASDVAAMETDELARRRVDEAVLLRKATSWRYELEWRLLGTRGSNPSPLELEEVVFGIRCQRTVRYAVVKALEDRVKRVRFCEMCEEPGSFTLRKHSFDTGALEASLPRRSRDAREGFSPDEIAALLANLN